MTLASDIIIIATFPSHILWDGHSCLIDTLTFSWYILVEQLPFTFLVSQTQCLGEHKIVENDSISINIKSCHLFLLYCKGCMSLSHKAFYLSAYILVELQSFPFIITQIKCLGEYKVVEECLYLHEY